MIGIIILNYISWSDTEQCILSIFKASNMNPYHIYLVDNNSPNKPDIKFNRLLRSNKITFIKSPLNRGYSAGNNIGVKAAIKDNCSEILISNSDVLYYDNSIDRLIESLYSNSDIGIVGPMIIYHGKPQYITRHCKTELKQKYLATTRLRHLFPRTSRLYYGKDLGPYKKSYVHDVSGCCYVMSRECAEKITPFDENTFLFEEELIIGIRVSEIGLKVLYDPSISVIHNHSGSTNHVKAFSSICGIKSEIYYCKTYLNASFFTIFPLYCIRTMTYLKRMIKEKDYRKNFKKYLIETFRCLIK